MRQKQSRKEPISVNASKTQLLIKNKLINQQFILLLKWNFAILFHMNTTSFWLF